MLRMPRRFRPCTEVSKPRGSCHSDAYTVCWNSPTWPRRSPKTWRSSASRNRLCNTSLRGEIKTNKRRLNLPLTRHRLPPAETDGTLAGDCQLLQNCRVYTTERSHSRGPMRGEMLRDATRSQLVQLLNFLTCTTKRWKETEPKCPLA